MTNAPRGSAANAAAAEQAGGRSGERQRADEDGAPGEKRRKLAASGERFDAVDAARSAGPHGDRKSEARRGPPRSARRSSRSPSRRPRACPRRAAGTAANRASACCASSRGSSRWNRSTISVTYCAIRCPCSGSTARTMGRCGGTSGVASSSSTPAPAQATNLSAGNRGVMPGASLNASSASTSPGGAVRDPCESFLRARARQRRALLLDERGRVENENGHGGREREAAADRRYSTRLTRSSRLRSVFARRMSDARAGVAQHAQVRVIDVHTHCLTEAWFELLQRHGGPRYSVQHGGGRHARDPSRRRAVHDAGARDVRLRPADPRR